MSRLVHVRAFGAAAALAILASACLTGGDSPLEIGVKRSAVDLVFKEELGPKAEPKRALGPQPAPAHAAFVTSVDEDLLATPSVFSALAAACPKAGPDELPKDPVSTVISGPPAEGRYGYRNSGTFKIEGLFTLEGPYPPVTTRTIRVIDPVGSSERFRFEAVQGSGENVTTTVYAVTNAALSLARLHVKTSQGEVEFEPTPPVRIMTLGAGEGTSWRSAGIDSATGTSMVVEGSIQKREAVDVCGEVYETYRVVSEETIVNVFTGFRHETNEPTVYNVATHLGGLFLAEDVDTTTTIPTTQGVVIVHLDYVSTAVSARPRAAS